MTTTPITSPAGSAAQRETVVLLHSSAASSRQWDLLAEALQPRFDVHAIDLHGHGRQPLRGGTRPLSLHDDAALALAVLQRAGGGHLVGHSYGGAVALHLAAAHPECVESLALYEPVPFRLLADHRPEDEATREILAVGGEVQRLVGAGDADAAAAHFVDYWSGAGTWDRLGPSRRLAVSVRMPVVAMQFGTLFDEPLPPAALLRLRMPLLCLHGTRSTRAAIVLAALLRELLPEARHEALTGLGHMGPLTDAARVNERLLRFWRADIPGWQLPARTAA
ncbi:MAG: alpha/beta hydrolase [Rubrivivax sp.]